MSKQRVYVVTGFELGWDNVVAVYSYDYDIEKLREEYPEDEYYIDDHVVYSDTPSS